MQELIDVLNSILIIISDHFMGIRHGLPYSGVDGAPKHITTFGESAVVGTSSATSSSR